MFWYPENSAQKGNVTDFSEWVWAKTDEKFQEKLFYRHHPELKPDIAKNTEKEFLFKSAYSKMQHSKVSFHKKFLDENINIDYNPTDWILEYKDDHQGVSAKILYSSKLFVDDNPLRGCPDIVFKNDNSGKLIIIETKITWVPFEFLKKEVYPNVRAQLWAYSWMNPWKEIKDDNIFLIANFWDVSLEKVFSSKIWKRSDPDLNQDCEGWFKEYGGIIDKSF